MESRRTSIGLSTDTSWVDASSVNAPQVRGRNSASTTATPQASFEVFYALHATLAFWGISGTIQLHSSGPSTT
jgi:hypothetical protein